MRSSFTSCALLWAAVASTVSCAVVTGDAIEKTISRKALSAKARQLQGIAYSTPARNRVMGSEGHQKTVDWITGYLDDMSDYYTYEVQPFEALFANSNGSLLVGGEAVESQPFEYSPSGNIKGAVVPVDNVGCEASDFPDAVDGKIALISRGTCEFGLKVALAGSAGATAAIIYNNAEGLIGGGTLGAPPRDEGPYVPATGISQADGQAILADIDGGATVSARVRVLSEMYNVTTYNIIAETKGGDHDNVLALGAHTDSVFAGPGINDDGSGTIGILEAAIQLSKFEVNNAVRFCWWSGEEFGLLGSTYYVSNLNQTAGEIEKIRLFLDFDMIASPNYIFAAYDGDGNQFGIPGPPGSAQVEHFYRRWFKSRGYNITGTAFDGRSDYQAFSDNGIPCGGLFTGADDIKTQKLFDKFGGVLGETLDQNYHSAKDNYNNLNFEAWVPMQKALVASVAEYATSFASLPVANKVKAREVGGMMRRAVEDDRFEMKGRSKVWKV